MKRFQRAISQKSLCETGQQVARIRDLCEKGKTDTQVSPFYFLLFLGLELPTLLVSTISNQRDNSFRVLLFRFFDCRFFAFERMLIWRHVYQVACFIYYPNRLFLKYQLWGPFVSSAVWLVGYPHSTAVLIIIQFIEFNSWKCTCHNCWRLASCFFNIYTIDNLFFKDIYKSLFGYGLNIAHIAKQAWGSWM